MKPKQIVPFHKALILSDEVTKPILFDGSVYKLPGKRRVEVWRVKGNKGLCVRIFRPTDDGKTSKLMFGLQPPAALALFNGLSEKLNGAAKERLMKK